MSSTFTDLPLATLRSAPIADVHDGGYQRRIRAARVEHMAVNWDDELYSPIDVVKGDVEDDTEYVVINGNHRLEARKRYGELHPDASPRITVHLHNGGSYTSLEEQAALYRKSNSRVGLWRTTVPLTPMEDFIAGVLSRDPECVAVNDILASYGLTPVRKGSEAGVAVVNLLAIYRKSPDGGAPLLDETFRVLTKAWPVPTADRHHGYLVRGLGLVIREERRQKRYTRKRLVESLAVQTPEHVILAVHRRVLDTRQSPHAEVTWASVIRDVVDPQLVVDGWPEPVAI